MFLPKILGSIRLKQVKGTPKKHRKNKDNSTSNHDLEVKSQGSSILSHEEMKALLQCGD